MGKHHLRANKECLNCGYLVQKRYCSNCGQENTETRQSFGHLVRHFFEDLTHYDSGFWKTIRYLLFRPAFLTKEFLAGKRIQYVPPVRLYIFISFLCFFLPYLLPDFSRQTKPDQPAHRQQEHPKQHDKFRTGTYWSGITMHGTEIGFDRPNDYTSVAQMDSMQARLPESIRYNWLEYRMAKKIIKIYAHHSEEEVIRRFNESFVHNIPKALFVYMPLFALLLWLIHGKKKWMYFDHAIYTLHNFSFILLALSIMSVADSICSIWNVDGSMTGTVLFLVMILFIWITYYLFRSHRKMYGESWIISTLKSTLLLGVNLVCLVVLLMLFCNITLFNLH